MQQARSFLALPRLRITACLLLWSVGGAISNGQPPPSAPWLTFGNGPTHSGFSPVTLGNLPISDGWSKAFPVAINQVAAAGGQVVLTTNQYFQPGMLALALDAATGNEIWRYPLGSALSISGATISDGKIFFSSCRILDDKRTPAGSFIFVLDSLSGKLVRQIPFETQAGTIRGPTVSGDSIWIPAGYFGGLGGFSLADGSQHFVTPLEMADDWTPTYDGKALYACINGVFTAVDPTTGTRLWTLDFRRPMEILVFAAQPIVANNKAFLISFGRLDQDSGGSVLLTAIDLTTQRSYGASPTPTIIPAAFRFMATPEFPPVTATLSTRSQVRRCIRSTQLPANHAAFIRRMAIRS
ncbi:MAG: hypothetical protein QOJ87_2528 [Verrucomicrobiota bacterium]